LQPTIANLVLEYLYHLAMRKDSSNYRVIEMFD